MKKIILVLCFGVISFRCIAQATGKTGYLQKSKNQKTAAWVLLGGGALVEIVGVIVYPKNLSILGNTQSELSRERTASVLLITGGAIMLSSIPFFVSSAKNKRKAMSVSFKNEWVPQLQETLVSYKTLPSLSFTIGL